MAKIRTHKERVEDYQASYALRTDGIVLPRMAKQAFIETWLVEDIAEYHRERMNQLIANGRGIDPRNVSRHAIIANLYKQLGNLCRSLIESGDYRTVSKSINERKMYRQMVNVSGMQMEKYAKKTAEIMRNMYEEMLRIERAFSRLGELQTTIENEDKNARSVYGLPEISDINNIVDAVNDLFNGNVAKIEVSPTPIVPMDENKNRNKPILY